MSLLHSSPFIEMCPQLDVPISLKTIEPPLSIFHTYLTVSKGYSRFSQLKKLVMSWFDFVLVNERLHFMYSNVSQDLVIFFVLL